MLEGEDGTDHTNIVPAAAGAGRSNPISAGAAAPFFDSGAFFMPAVHHQWRAALGNRKVGRSLCPVCYPSVACRPLRSKRTAGSLRTGVSLC